MHFLLAQAYCVISLARLCSCAHSLTHHLSLSLSVSLSPSLSLSLSVSFSSLSLSLADCRVWAGGTQGVGRKKPLPFPFLCRDQKCLEKIRIYRKNPAKRNIRILTKVFDSAFA